MKLSLRYFTFTSLFVAACTPLPKNKLPIFKAAHSYELKGDSIHILLNNPLHCPLRVNLRSKNPADSVLKQNFPLTLAPLKDTLISYANPVPERKHSLRFTSTLGSIFDSVLPGKIELPFPKNKTYKIIQSYQGKRSHFKAYSKYALDFSLQVNDTVCSAADGYVVSVVEGYKHGGETLKWRDYANFITVFHPKMNIYTQYVHLAHQGSFVTIGDFVKGGEPIGLSGKTGYTNIAHLHFNVLQPNSKGLESIPISFKEGFHGKDLKRDMKVKK